MSKLEITRIKYEKKSLKRAYSENYNDQILKNNSFFSSFMCLMKI